MDTLLCVCIIFILLMIHTLWPKYVYDAQYDELIAGNVLTEPYDIDLQTGDIIFIKNCVKCKYDDDFMNNWFQFAYRNMFNTARWYITDQAPYTHTGVIVRLNIDGEEKPYICHVDGGMPMYDELRHKYIAGTGSVVSKLNHINVCGGVVHMYKYIGSPIKKDVIPWIKDKQNSTYPKSIYNLAMSNGLQINKNPTGVMACTDFLENIVCHMGISDKKPSGQASINDIVNLVKDNKFYETVPVVLKNKCYEMKHFK